METTFEILENWLDEVSNGQIQVTRQGTAGYLAEAITFSNVLRPSAKSIVAACGGKTSRVALVLLAHKLAAPKKGGE